MNQETLPQRPSSSKNDALSRLRPVSFSVSGTRKRRGTAKAEGRFTEGVSLGKAHHTKEGPRRETAAT